MINKDNKKNILLLKGTLKDVVWAICGTRQSTDANVSRGTSSKNDLSFHYFL